MFKKLHFRPKWTSRLNAAIYCVGHYRPGRSSCLLDAALLFFCSFCALIAWCVIQNERRLVEKEWEAIRAMEATREPGSPTMAKPPDSETR